MDNKKKESLAEKQSASSDVERSSGGEGVSESAASSAPENRRDFLANVVMAGGLVASYGTLGCYALRFLAPDDEDKNLGWQFVGTLDSLKGIDSLDFIASSGVKIVIARAKEGGVDDSGKEGAMEADPEGVADVIKTGFLALSSVCPHLGCQVFWEAANNRFFCPCHNGVFDASGKATGGPPGEAKQSLTQFPTKIHNGALYVKAPLKTVTDKDGEV